MSRPRRRLAAWLSWALIPMLAACGSVRQAEVLSRGEIARLVEARGIEPEELVLPHELTPEMRAWAHRQVPVRSQVGKRLETLLNALVSPSGRDIRYESGYTPTAAEAFATGRANCLGFTHLFVGLARELGMEVYYLDVERARTYERDGDLIVVSGHITAGYGTPVDRSVLEFSVGPEVDYGLVRPVSDLRAVAMYYSNRGAELVRDGRRREALEWLRVAVTLDPELADGWVNYGVALRRLGDEAAAEEAYRRALEVDAGAVAAYQNLASLLRLEERHQEAVELLSLTRKLGDFNPYNYLSLGDLSRRLGDLEEAERFYRRALRLAGDTAEPYASLGLLALDMDRRGEAQRWLARARKRDEHDPRTRALARRLAPGTGSGGMARITSSPKP